MLYYYYYFYYYRLSLLLVIIIIIIVTLINNNIISRTYNSISLSTICIGVKCNIHVFSCLDSGVAAKILTREEQVDSVTK